MWVMLIGLLTGVAIEMSMAKDESLTVVITGKGEHVMKARKMVVQQLQTQVHILFSRFAISNNSPAPGIGEI